MAVFSALVAHLLLIKASGVNFEFAFIDASAYFKNLNPTSIHQFFFYQANTLGLSYLAHIISLIFPGVELLILIRLINLVGLILLTLGVINICHFLNKKSYTVITVLLVLNPLIWTYVGRATADFLPMALGVFSISLALGSKQFSFQSFFSGLLFGLSCLLKYHTIVILIFLLPLMYDKFSLRFIIRKILFILMVITPMLTYYLITIKSNFDFWITPPRFLDRHRVEFNISNLFNNIVLYCGFLSLIVLPTTVFSEEFFYSIKKYWKSFLAILFISVFFGATFFIDLGELNFGPLDVYLDEKFRIFILSFLFLLPFVLLMIPDKNKNFRSRMGLSVLVALILLSSTRPAQRYLLFVIPFFIFFIPENILKSKTVILSTCFLFFLINSFIELSRFSSGSAAEKMVDKLVRDGILQQTIPGVIEGHVGNKFFEAKDFRKYYIVASRSNSRTIFSVTSGASFFKKTFFLEKIE
jgi:hypothetical protein